MCRNRQGLSHPNVNIGFSDAVAGLCECLSLLQHRRGFHSQGDALPAAPPEQCQDSMQFRGLGIWVLTMHCASLLGSGWC